VSGPNKELIKGIKADLATIYEMTDMGPDSNFLGLQIIRDCSKCLLEIHQEDYIEAMLARFGMTNCKSAHTPLPAGIKLEKSTTVASYDFRTEYQSLIRSILFTGIALRADVHMAVICLSHFCSNPSEAHMKAGKHILQYL
jgi:hypothetical protein